MITHSLRGGVPPPPPLPRPGLWGSFKVTRWLQVGSPGLQSLAGPSPWPCGRRERVRGRKGHGPQGVKWRAAVRASGCPGPPGAPTKPQLWSPQSRLQAPVLMSRLPSRGSQPGALPPPQAHVGTRRGGRVPSGEQDSNAEGEAPVCPAARNSPAWQHSGGQARAASGNDKPARRRPSRPSSLAPFAAAPFHPRHPGEL